MTWDPKDLRKNVDPVPKELLEEQGVGKKDVGEKTPYNELLEELWAPYIAGMDAPLAASSIPLEVKKAMAERGFMTPEQLAFKRKIYMRDVQPDSGLHDPSLYQYDC